MVARWTLGIPPGTGEPFLENGKVGRRPTNRISADAEHPVGGVEDGEGHRLDQVSMDDTQTQEGADVAIILAGNCDHDRAVAQRAAYLDVLHREVPARHSGSLLGGLDGSPCG